jgi:hypothetical protein
MIVTQKYLQSMSTLCVLFLALAVPAKAQYAPGLFNALYCVSRKHHGLAI